MNYPAPEQKQAYLDDLKALEIKHGMGLNIGGWEYEVDFVAASHSNLVEQAEQAMQSQPSRYDGWDNVLGIHGPPIPSDLRKKLNGPPVTAVQANEILREVYEGPMADAINDLNHTLFGENKRAEQAYADEYKMFGEPE